MKQSLWIIVFAGLLNSNFALVAQNDDEQKEDAELLAAEDKSDDIKETYDIKEARFEARNEEAQKKKAVHAGKAPLEKIPVTPQPSKTVTPSKETTVSEKKALLKPGVQELLSAAVTGDVAKIKAVLDKKIDVDARGSNGETALILASEAGFLDAVKLLIEKNAAINGATIGKRYTALRQAAQNGHETVVDYLLKKGAQADITDTDGRTPLWVAAMNGHASIAKKLLDKGAEKDRKDYQEGVTPLIMAAQAGHLPVVKLLVEAGADINAKAEKAMKVTALRQAAQNGFADVVKYLLAKGADKDLADTQGFTALTIAQKNKHDAVAALLKDQSKTSAAAA